MKKLIVDKYSPIKHLCRVNPLGEITPVSSFARDYEVNEEEWGDDYVMVYAYKMYDSVKATDSEILDHTEYGKHIKIYSDLSKLDGNMDIPMLEDSTNMVAVTTRIEAHTLMNILTSYLVCYPDEDVDVAHSIRELVRCLYLEDGFAISVKLPDHYKDFIGVK